ncbi:ABC1-domain-containing protein [Coniophora puteana RWD-64-598 SS2]|uniref:ABC1-domain-containing protein n=1 Tax=Coniophora puteana (strain RWD-64-598) TaxID=741705 RepID=A0A5M3M6R8_CONPW|nr:ABC1-domain-containing protein [Coniophora puteana RWD-64-598 SS2]EIW74807.1 ABC1-domain-containing protein [Coniophora puteana RWD-64-598 SS2]
MPPGAAYNWLCALHSAADIAARAVQIRAAQAQTHAVRQVPAQLGKRKRGIDASYPEHLRTRAEPKPNIKTDAPLYGLYLREESSVSEGADGRGLGSEGMKSMEESCAPPMKEERKAKTQETGQPPPPVQQESGLSLPFSPPVPPEPAPSPDAPDAAVYEPQTPLMDEEVKAAQDAAVSSLLPDEPIQTRNLQSSKVPSSRIGRFFHYGGLAASLSYGAAAEVLRRSTSGASDTQQQGSLMLTEANVRRLVSKLSQMRGAALKLGQFMSIQDTHLLPPEVDKIFRRVQDSAHYMPDWQMEQVLTKALGPAWSSNFTSFDRVPFAAASIGQVHRATLAAAASPTGKEERVAVKIQFPNIANSIASDLGYVKMILTAGALLPKGLFLDRTMQVMKEELADECDYKREAGFLRRYGSAEYLGLDARFKIPWAWEGSTDNVLVMEHVRGVSVGEALVKGLTQEERNGIAERIIELCLRELFEFRLMQTDPNFTNFLYDSATRQISLVDFGATREYSKSFMDNWLHLLQAAAAGDVAACKHWSLQLGYLTGEENEVMVQAHVNSIVHLATPFKASTRQPFAFGPGSEWARITREIREQIPVMLKYRLTPPPRETYSLNRKLSGAFLLAARLDAVVDTKKLWDGVVDKYRFD